MNVLLHEFFEVVRRGRKRRQIRENKRRAGLENAGCLAQCLAMSHVEDRLEEPSAVVGVIWLRDLERTAVNEVQFVGETGVCRAPRGVLLLEAADRDAVDRTALGLCQLDR